jgi:hypothetical protein
MEIFFQDNILNRRMEGNGTEIKINFKKEIERNCEINPYDF